MLQFYRLCEKIKCAFITNDDNHEIIFNYTHDLNEDNEEKELNKLTHWTDNIDNSRQSKENINEE